MGYEAYKPQEDSWFRLLRCCGCHSEDVVYIQVTTGGQPQYRARCRFCGRRTPWYSCKHDAQVDWNGRFGEIEKL